MEVHAPASRDIEKGTRQNASECDDHTHVGLPVAQRIEQKRVVHPRRLQDVDALTQRGHFHRGHAHAFAAAFWFIGLGDDAENTVSRAQEGSERRHRKIRRSKQHDSHDRGLSHGGSFMRAKLCELSDALDVETPFQRTETVQHQNALDVVIFVLHGASQQPFAFEREGVAVPVASRHRDCRCACDSFDIIGQAQAAFLLDHLSVVREDGWVRHHDRGVLGAFDRAVDNEQLQRQADLVGCKPDPRSGVHGLDHVVNETMQFRVECRDGVARLRQDRVGIMTDRSNHCVLGCMGWYCAMPFNVLFSL